MLLSVIIPCHGGVEDTRQCILSLLAQRGAPELEILVVDNASDDETPHLDRELDGVRVLRQDTNLGFAGGVNRGLEAARGDLLLVLNNDTRAAPQLLERLRRALLSDSRIAVAAPVSNHVKGPARIAVGAAGSTPEGCREVEDALTASWSGVLDDVDTLAGLCMLFRRELVREIGPFDERFGPGNFEDDDLCLRARLRGHRLVVVRDAFLHHHGHRTFDAMGIDYRASLGERHRLFAAKWAGDPAGAAVVALLDDDLRTAARHAERGLRVHPSWPDGHWLIARHCIATGEPARAIPHLESFLAAAPRHGGAHARLALARMETGEEAAGRRRLGWALQHCYFDDGAAAAILSRLAKREVAAAEPERAVEWLRLAVDLRSDDGELHNQLGAALMEIGRLDDALVSLQRADRLGNRYGATNAGICLWRLGRPAEALRSLRRAVEEQPDDPIARQNLEAALASCSAGHPEERPA